MTLDKPLVSVIIPIYKVEKYLRASIDSALNQTYENIEIILVDDGSPDACPQICDDYAEKYDNIKVIHKKNGGLSDARNHGIEASSGEYLYFLDSDDTIDSRAVELCVQSAADSVADAVISDRYYEVFESSTEKKLCFHFDASCYINDPVKFACEVMIAKGRAWRATAVLYNAKTIKDNKCLFPVGYTAEDIVFNLQVMSCSKTICFCDEPFLFNLKREGSITASFNDKFFDTIVFIDDKVKEFMDKADVDKVYADTCRNSLLSRNVIAYLFSLFRKNNALSKSEKDALYHAIVNNERVREAFADDMKEPYFNNKFLAKFCVVLHNILAAGHYKMAATMISMINRLR